MSKWPQRSVSVSDQTWICFFGVNPEVLLERTVSDIIQPPIRDQKHDRFAAKGIESRWSDFYLNLRRSLGFAQHACRHPFDNPPT
jgi:hypothetical protein